MELRDAKIRLEILLKDKCECPECMRNKKAYKTVLQALENSIPKKKIEEYLAEETEKYKVYKKEVDKNENLRGQLWHHMGAKNMCEKILGIEKTVTLY